MPRLDRIVLRHGLDANWEIENPVLDDGEPGYVDDTRILKVGDGESAWLDLLPIGGDSTALEDALEAHIANTSNPHGVTKTQLGLGSVDNTSDASKPVSTATQTALDLKAPLASPSLTGVPTAPTAALGTNTTQIATMAAVKAAIDALLAGSPGALDTLNELAAALGNDALFSTTVTNALALKAPLASPALTGVPTAPTAAVDTNTTQAATTAFVVGQAGASTPAMDGSAAVGTSKRYARDDHVHPTDTSRAPLASPTLTGTPAAPTAAADTNTTQLATTAYVIGQKGTATPIVDGTGAAGTSNRWTPIDHIHPTDTSRAPLASPTFTGTPSGPTPAADANTTQLATTAYVIGQKGTATPIVDGTGASGTSDKWTPIDHVHPTDTSRAAVASPTFTGTPAAPTASVDTNTTQVATTAYVLGQKGTATPIIDGVGAAGTSNRWTPIDHVHPTDTTRAPLASPTFTGTPAAPTASADDSTTQVATTAYVIGQKGTATPIVNGTGAAGTSNKWAPIDHVHPTDTSRAALASPAFTGTPTAPTAAAGTNTTQVATTAFVTAAMAGGVAGVATFNGRSGTVVPANDDYAATMLSAIAANSILGNNTSAPARPIVLTTAQVKTLLAIASGDVSGLAASATTDATNASNIGSGTLASGRLPAFGSGDVSFATGGGAGTIASGAVSLAKMASLAANSIIGNNTGAGATPIALTAAQVKTLLAIAVADVSGAAPLASPTFTGTPAAPTPSAADSTTKIATTAFVQGELTAKAPLASPTFTGTPAAPTAAADTNTTQVATTAYVIGQKGTATPIVDGTGAAGTSNKWAPIDHVHPTDTSRAALASPTFTGTPAAPTAPPGTNTTQLATTAFVAAAVTGGSQKYVNRAFGSYTTNANLTTAIPLDDTIPQITEGTEVVTASITPASTSNRIRARFSCMVAGNGGIAQHAIAALFQDATANALCARAVKVVDDSKTYLSPCNPCNYLGNAVVAQLVLEWEWVPATVSAITARIRVGGNSGTIRLNGTTGARYFGGVSAATLVLEEITP